MTAKQEGIERRKRLLSSLSRGASSIKKGFGRGVKRISKALGSLPSRDKKGITAIGALRSLKIKKRK